MGTECWIFFYFNCEWVTHESNDIPVCGCVVARDASEFVVEFFACLGCESKGTDDIVVLKLALRGNEWAFLLWRVTIWGRYVGFKMVSCGSKDGFLFVAGFC